MLIKDELFGKEIYATPEEYLKAKGTESAITGIFCIVIAIAFLTFTSVWLTLFFVFLTLTCILYYTNKGNTDLGWTKWDFVRISFYQANKFTIGIFMIPLVPIALGILNLYMSASSDTWEGPVAFTFSDINWILVYHRYIFLSWIITTGISAWIGSTIVANSIRVYLTQVSTPNQSIVTFFRIFTIIFTITAGIVAFFDGEFAPTFRPLELKLGSFLFSVVNFIGGEIEYIFS